ncbi:MAG: hypothetical protein Q8P31_04015 [Bacillota bacterium]|nr:hypothetical protein [Bacillota bacterium]
MPMLTGLAAAAVAYGVLGTILPISLWFLLSPLFLITGAFAHLWLAAVVLGGMPALTAFRMGIQVLRDRLAVFGMLLGAALAAEIVLSQAFALVWGHSGSLFWHSTLGRLLSLISMAASTAFSVVFRVAVFTAFAEQVDVAAATRAPAGGVPG